MYENKISARQLRRMIFIETFGAGALSIPTFACYKEQNGFWSLIFYGNDCLFYYFFWENK